MRIPSFGRSVRSSEGAFLALVTVIGCSTEPTNDAALAATDPKADPSESESTTSAPVSTAPPATVSIDPTSGSSAMVPTIEGPPSTTVAPSTNNTSGAMTTPGSSTPPSSDTAPDENPVGGGGTDGTAANGGAPGGASGAVSGSGGSLGGGFPGGGSDSGGSAAGGMEVAGGAAGSVGVEPTFHVFLLLGQSNMAGYPKAQEADRVEDPRVTVLGFDDCATTGRVADEWDVAAPPLHECWNDGLGPGDYFAKTLLEILPEGDTIGLIPCAVSGEKIETFMKVGGSRYEWIIERARRAQDIGGVIQGLLFHQGESNSGDSSWPGKVNTFVSDLRVDLAIPDAPFLAGELLYSGSTAGHNTLVNQLPSLLDRAYVVSAEGLVVDPSDSQWNLHFDHDSTVTFGQRYAATMIEALGW